MGWTYFDETGVAPKKHTTLSKRGKQLTAAMDEDSTVFVFHFRIMEPVVIAGSEEKLLEWLEESIHVLGFEHVVLGVYALNFDELNRYSTFYVVTASDSDQNFVELLRWPTQTFKRMALAEPSIRDMVLEGKHQILRLQRTSRVNPKKKLLGERKRMGDIPFKEALTPRD